MPVMLTQTRRRSSKRTYKASFLRIEGEQNVQDRDSLIWLESTGGPLILLEEDLLPYWGGYLSSFNSGVTDYERACEVSDYLGSIKVASRSGVLLGEQPYATTWWEPSELDDGLIVRWVSGEDEAASIQELTQVPISNWERTNVEIEVVNGRLVLFDSVEPGDNIETFIVIQKPKGTYVAETQHYNPDSNTSLILHRFVPKTN
jgi:hypothetical protein